MRVRFVVATRSVENEFFERSLLIESLENLPDDIPFSVEPMFESSQGMAACYNPAIECSLPGDLLVFVHDDVYIDDWFVTSRLREALAIFDVIGVAGARVRMVGQKDWWGIKDADGQTIVPAERSGMIRHARAGRRERIARAVDTWLAPPRAPWVQRWQIGEGGGYQRVRQPDAHGAVLSARHAGTFGGRLDYFGPAPTKVQLLDGVFIAARADRLRSSTVRFDPLFKYHLYDLDFCRQCEVAGLSIGTWPIALSHASQGRFDEVWQATAATYLRKWEG